MINSTIQLAFLAQHEAFEGVCAELSTKGYTFVVERSHDSVDHLGINERALLVVAPKDPHDDIDKVLGDIEDCALNVVGVACETVFAKLADHTTDPVQLGRLVSFLESKLEDAMLANHQLQSQIDELFARTDTLHRTNRDLRGLYVHLESKGIPYLPERIAHMCANLAEQTGINPLHDYEGVDVTQH